MNQPVLIIYFHSKLIRSVQHTGTRPSREHFWWALEKIKSTKLNILKLNRKLDVSDKRKCHKKDALDDN